MALHHPLPIDTHFNTIYGALQFPEDDEVLHGDTAIVTFLEHLPVPNFKACEFGVMQTAPPVDAFACITVQWTSGAARPWTIRDHLGHVHQYQTFDQHFIQECTRLFILAENDYTRRRTRIYPPQSRADSARLYNHHPPRNRLPNGADSTDDGSGMPPGPLGSDAWRAMDRILDVLLYKS